MVDERDWLTRKRFFPRIFSGFYMFLFAEANWIFWALPEPNNAQGIAYGAICGAAAAWFKFYVDTGNN